jgi:hypothetical protein
MFASQLLLLQQVSNGPALMWNMNFSLKSTLWRMVTFVSWCAVQETTIGGWTKSQRKGHLGRGTESERGPLWWILNNLLLRSSLSRILSHMNRYLSHVAEDPWCDSADPRSWHHTAVTSGESACAQPVKRSLLSGSTFAPYSRLSEQLKQTKNKNI